MKYIFDLGMTLCGLVLVVNACLFNVNLLMHNGHEVLAFLVVFPMAYALLGMRQWWKWNKAARKGPSAPVVMYYLMM